MESANAYLMVLIFKHHAEFLSQVSYFQPTLDDGPVNLGRAEKEEEGGVERDCEPERPQ